MNDKYMLAGTSNAIDNTVFVVVLGSPLVESEMASLKKACLDNEFNKIFPHYEDIRVFTVSISTGNKKTAPAPAPGFVYQEYSRSGKVAWELKVKDNSFTLTCGDYTDWKDVIEKAKKIFDVLLSAVPSRKVMKLVHSCSDCVIFDGGPAEYVFSEIFNTESNFLNPASSNRNPPWHLYQGFFRSKSEYEENVPFAGFWLDALNIRTVLRGAYVDTFAEHVNQFDLEHPSLCIDLQKEYHKVFEEMHSHNKDVVLGLLSSEMLIRVGLRE